MEPAGMELVLYHHTEYCEQDIDMEAAVPVDKSLHGSRTSLPALAGAMVIHTLPPVPNMATVIYQGRPADVEQAVTALWHWIGANEFETAGPFRELHLYGKELELTSLENPVTMEFQVPVQKLRT